MQKFVEVNIGKQKQNNDRSNNQSARFTGNKKKSTNIHLVADDGEILKIQRENIQGDPQKTEPTNLWIKLLILIFLFLFRVYKSTLCMKDWNYSLPQHVLANQGKDILHGGLFCQQIIHCSASKFSETVLCHHAPSKSRIFDWVQKFREYGTVQNLNSKGLRDTYSGQRVSARTERNIDAVRDSVGWSPKKSLQQCSRQELGISWESLRHVLKSDLHLYPYQIQIKQKLMEADMEKPITAEAIWSIFWKEHDFYANQPR